MKQTLHYRVYPFDPAGHRLKVQLEIPSPSRRCQIVSLPAWIPGSYLIRDFSRHIESIRAWCGKTVMTPQKINTNQWAIDGCTGPLTIEMVIYAWDLSVREAHVDESHAFFNGTSVFLMAEGLQHLPCTVQIQAPPHTTKWKAYTSMPVAPEQGSKGTVNSIGSYIAPNYDALIDHPFELGTPAVITFKAFGALHEMVFTGVAPGLDLARIARDTKRICEAQMALFEPAKKEAPFVDSASKYVFMTLVTKDGYGGLEHRASTALVTSRKDLPVKAHQETPAGYTQFLGLVSHEYFHTWHVKRIKPAAFVPYDLLVPNHTRLLWVFEGFTSYYDDLMLLRSGVIDLPAYLKLLGKTIASVYAGGGRLKQSLAHSSFDAWTKYYKQDENAPNAIVSYYTKGALVALGLDLTIRLATVNRRSLDDVMRLLWQRFGKRFYGGRARGLGETELAALIKQATGVDVSLELTQWVQGVADVPLADLLARSGVELSWVSDTDTPDLGFTTKTSGPDLMVRQVFEHGPGHIAGLSAGDQLVAVNGLKVGGSEATLSALLRPYQAEQVIDLHVFRGDLLKVYRLRLAPPKNNTCHLIPMHS